MDREYDVESPRQAGISLLRIPVPNEPLAPSNGDLSPRHSTNSESSVRFRGSGVDPRHTDPMGLPEEAKKEPVCLKPGFKQVPVYKTNARFVMYVIILCTLLSCIVMVLRTNRSAWTLGYVIAHGIGALIGAVGAVRRSHWILTAYLVVSTIAFLGQFVIRLVWSIEDTQAYVRDFCFHDFLSGEEKTVVENLCTERVLQHKDMLITWESLLTVTILLFNASATWIFIMRIKEYLRKKGNPTKLASTKL